MAPRGVQAVPETRRFRTQGAERKVLGLARVHAANLSDIPAFAVWCPDKGRTDPTHDLAHQNASQWPASYAFAVATAPTRSTKPGGINLAGSARLVFPK